MSSSDDGFERQCDRVLAVVVVATAPLVFAAVLTWETLARETPMIHALVLSRSLRTGLKNSSNLKLGT